MGGDKMDEQTRARCEQLATVMKALGHPTRAFIVMELEAGSRCVCELTDMIGADTSTVSKHLTLLKNAGLVRSEKKGLMVHYSLATPCLPKFYSCVEELVRNSMEEKQKLLQK